MKKVDNGADETTLPVEDKDSAQLGKQTTCLFLTSSHLIRIPNFLQQPLLISQNSFCCCMLLVLGEQHVCKFNIVCIPPPRWLDSLSQQQWLWIKYWTSGMKFNYESRRKKDSRCSQSINCWSSRVSWKIRREPGSSIEFPREDNFLLSCFFSLILSHHLVSATVRPFNQVANSSGYTSIRQFQSNFINN